MALIPSKVAVDEANATLGYVQLRPETKMKLSKLAATTNDMTFDDVITRLIKLAKKHGLDSDSD